MTSPLDPIRVVLADDHAMVRESLARVLDASGTIRVEGQAGTGREIVPVVREHQPQCLVMDYSMPDHDASGVIRQLIEDFPLLRILVLTVHENVHYAVRTIQAGAHGYLIKSAAVDELVEAIRTVHEGDVYISRKISADVWSRLRHAGERRNGLDALSAREFEVLRAIGSGLTIQHCARRLEISVSTVSTYRARLLEKLNLATTAELIRFAIENGITE